MSKKLMLLAAGALTALAFTALPGMASASEFKSTCSTGANCTATIAGGKAVLENDAGGALGTVTCGASAGTATITHNTSTSHVELTFTDCTGPFSSKCTSPGAAAATITTNTMVGHNINLEPGQTNTVGILLTGANVTFTCAGFFEKTVTGNVIGELEEGSTVCNTPQASHKITFVPGAATGSQRWTQITTSGTMFDLISGTHANDGTTSSQEGTGTITYNAGAKVTLDC